MDEQKRDQETPDSAVAVEERVDRLELRVRQTGVDERRERLLVEKPLEVVQRHLHLRDRRRDESGLVQGRVLGPDPVLRAAELAREAVGATGPRKQLTMDLGDQAERERQVAQSSEPVVHRVDVPDDFLNVLGQASPRGRRLQLGGEEVLERALGPLDLRAEDGFAPDVHVDEEVRVWDRLDDAVEPSHRLVGLGEEGVQRPVERDRWIGGQGSRWAGCPSVASTASTSPRSTERITSGSSSSVRSRQIA